jgi:ankyrin repeat protein
MKGLEELSLLCHNVCQYQGTYDQVVELLLKANAIVKIQNFEGSTALMEACIIGHNQIIISLLISRAFSLKICFVIVIS